MGMWSELENYVKVPYYTCGKCECGINVMTKIVNMAGEKKTH